MHRTFPAIHQVRLLCLLLSLWILLGCQEQTQPQKQPSIPIEYKSQFHFEQIDGPQEVVFLTESWMGGGGDPVLLGHGASRTLHYKRLPIYVDSIAHEIIGKQLPERPAGAKKILIKANVHLEPALATIPSNPPSRRSIYRVVIDELHSADWY